MNETDLAAVTPETPNMNTASDTQHEKATGLNLPEILRMNDLDREFLDRTEQAGFFDNPDTAFDYLDGWTERRFGVNGMRGKAWNIVGRTREAYKTPQLYANALNGLLARGYSAVATPEYVQWTEAETAGDKQAMMKAANVSPVKRGEFMSADGLPIGSQDVEKTQDEIDAELSKYATGIKAQNFMAHMQVFGDDFSPEEKEIVYAALEGGDGLPAEHEALYREVLRADPEKGARIAALIRLSRANDFAWVYDTFIHPLSSGMKNVTRGIKDEAKDYFEMRFLESHMANEIGRTEAKYYWNDEEKKAFNDLTARQAARSLQLSQRGLDQSAMFQTFTSASEDGITNPKAFVDQMAARRMAREALPRAEQLRQRKEELMVRMAMDHIPYDDYDPVSKTISTTLGMLPYMGTAGIPYAGGAVAALAQFGNVRNDIIMEGGDPDDAVGVQLFLSVGYAAIEKLQGVTLTKPLTQAQKKALLGAITKTAWKNGKMNAIGKAVSIGSGEALTKTFNECIEEGMQAIVEGGTKQWWMPQEKGGGDFKKALKAGLVQGAEDFIGSLGPMGILSVLGTGGSMKSARRMAHDRDSLVDLIGRKMQAINIMKGAVADNPSLTPEIKDRRVLELFNDLQTIWRNAPNGRFAMEQMREKYALNDAQAMTLVDFFDVSEAVSDSAKWANSDEEAKAILSLAGNFRIGKDTTYNITDLFKAINADITVEDVQVEDRTKSPVASPAVEKLRQERDEEMAAVENAKVGSERRAAERRLRRVNRRLKAAEQKENAVSYPKMTMKRVTIPVGKNGETRSFVIRETNEAPDIHNSGYAASVADAMAGVEGTIDGKSLSIEEFKALPSVDKMHIAVTPEQYMAMTEEERGKYVGGWALGGSGSFSVLDENNREIFNSDGIVELFRGKAGTPGARLGGNWSLAHEYTHGVVRFLRDLGAIDEGTVTLMQKLFGAPVAKDELWNEEAMANGFADFLRDEFDFRRLTPEERREAMGFFERVWDIIKDFFRRIFGKEIDEPPVVTNLRKEAERAVFNALRNGDLSGLDQYAGIEFEEEKEETREESAQNAQKQTSKPSEEKPVNEPPKGEERAPIASTRSNTQPKVESTSESADWRTVVAQSTDIAAVVEQIENPIATAANLPARTNTKMTIFTPGYEMEIECEMMWVPLDELAESTDDREVQMRDRTRRATDEQVRSKTRKGVFRPLALFPGKKSDDGAPIVGGGMKIISGHGRKRMLEQLAAEGRFGEYLSAINAEATQKGVPTAPEGMKNPVLVLRVTGGLDKKSDLNRFAELSNRWGGLERSGAELAESDARKITDALLRLYAPDNSGNLLAASNRPFMAAFLNEVGATGLTNADGTPTPEAALRVQRALMTAIFGNDEKIRAIIQNLLEKSGELSLGNLQNALMRSAGKLLAMKRAKGSFDIVNDVREAAYHYIAWRSAQQKQKGLSFADYLKEQDMFTASATPMQEALAQLLDVGRFGMVLDEYAVLVAKEAVDAQGSFDFAEKRTPLQLLGYAERNILAPEETPVTPDPTSAAAAEPVQTPPAVSEETSEISNAKPATQTAKPETQTTKLSTAQAVITPPAPETFTPAPLVRGTATLPGPGAEGIKAHQVNANGEPATRVKTLPAGAWNLLRTPFDVRRPPKASAQDKAGRGLKISNPPPVEWNGIFPHFQGNKTEMADRTSQAIRANMTKAEREHYTTVVDYFGGGGCWGLFHALANFPNAKTLVINEFDPDRLGKIRLLHEIDGEVADIAEKILFDNNLYPRIKEACAGSSAPVTAANKVDLFKREITDPTERAAIQAFIDCAHTMLGSQAEADDPDPVRTGIKASLETLRKDGRKAKEAADAFKAREGATIRYVSGDAVANADTLPHGDNVMAIADPPYYLTADYQQKTILGLEKVPDNWSYRATQEFIHKLTDSGDGLVYTDEAWWFKENYSPDQQDDLFGGGSKFAKEQEILLDIINTLDHFDVAGRVVGRQEVLGIHHGHTTDSKSEGSTNGNDVLVDSAADQRGNTGDRHSVRRMAAEPQGQSGRDGTAGGERGLDGARASVIASGRRALAREVIIQDIAASLESAATEIAQGADVDLDVVSRLARYSVRQVREERMAQYANFVSTNAKQLLETMDADGLPIPLEMRADQSMSDIRFSVQMGKRAREEAAAMIRKYRPDLAENDATALIEARERHPDVPVLTEDENVMQEIWDAILPKIVDHIAAFETPKERKAALHWFIKGAIRLPEDAPKVTEAIKTAERAKVDPMQYDRPGAILEEFSEFRPKEPPINPDTVPELTDKREMGNGVTTYLVQDDKAGQLAMRKIINTHWGKDANPWCLLQGDGDGNLSDGSNGGYNAWHYWQHYNALPKRVAFQDGKLLAFMATDKSQKLTSLPTRQYDSLVRNYETETGRDAHDKNGDITDAFLNWYNNGTHQNQEWWDRADEPHKGIPMKRVTKGETEYGASTTTDTIEIMQDGTEVVTSKKRESIAPDGTRTIEEWGANGDPEVYERRTRYPSGMHENVHTWGKHDTTYFSTVTNNIMEIHTLRNSDQTTKEITWKVDYRTSMRLLSGHDGYTLYRYERGAFRETDQKHTPDTVETWLASAEAALRRGEAVPPLPESNEANTPRFSVSSAGAYGGELRTLAHDIKDGKSEAIERAATLMAPSIPEKAILVPMPSHEGRATTMLTLANAIAAKAQGASVLDALEAEPHESNYEHKKRTGKPTDIKMSRIKGVRIPKSRPVILIDNVIATATTYNAALKALPNADIVVLASDARHSVRITKKEYALLSSRVTENDAKAYKAGREPLPWGVANTGDYGYLYDRFNDTTFAVRKRWLLGGRNDKFFNKYQKAYDDEFNKTAAMSRKDNEALRNLGRGDLRDDPNWIRDRTTAVDDAGLPGLQVRPEGRIPEGAGSNLDSRGDSQRLSNARTAVNETPEQRETMRNSVFMGARGAVRTDKLDSLVAAIERFKEKHSENYTNEARDDIYINTGWWKGTDGQWRVEIPDMRIKKVDYLEPSTYNGEDAELKLLGELVSNTRLFKAYPDLKRLPIVFLPDESDQIKGARGVYNGYEILLPYDALTTLDPDDGEIRLTREYIFTLTHEVQHAIQHIEGFAPGGNRKDNGSRNYPRLAGEVEARNAAFRYGGAYGSLVSARQDEDTRRQMIESRMAPWQTEDVPTLKQIIVDENGRMTDPQGNQVARHHVRAARKTFLGDVVTAYVASQRLAGNDVRAEDVNALIKNVGLVHTTPKEIIDSADRIVQSDKDKANALIARNLPELVDAARRLNMEEKLSQAVAQAITTGARAADPETGRILQKAIVSKQVRDLRAANGFEAAQMLAELPISLSEALYAVSVLERTPEELERLEKIRKEREEERAKALETEESAAEAADDEAPVREPTDEERAALDSLMDRAKFADEAFRKEQERKKAERKKREAQNVDGDTAGSNDDPDDLNGDGNGAESFALPEETVRRIAPVFDSSSLFAQFIVEWTSDKVLEKHPRLTSTGKMWKDPVAIRELKQTAANILRSLAQDTLGSSGLSRERNLVDHALNELESDIELTTYNGVRRRIARIYEQIHTYAHRVSKRKLINELVDTIDTMIQKGRFSYTQEEMDRKIPAKVEQWARWVKRYATMGEKKLSQEIARLKAITEQSPIEGDSKPPTPLEVAEAADQLAIAQQYGHLRGKKLGEINDITAYITQQLNGARQQFELDRAIRDERMQTIRSAIANAIAAGGINKRARKANRGKVSKAIEAMIGPFSLELQDLIRYCQDESLRTAALAAIEELTIEVNEGGTRYANALNDGRNELTDGLRICYGNTISGIKHLNEPLPQDVIDKFFTQAYDKKPTYGHLLQLYASCLQRDYDENIKAYGRDQMLEGMEAALTDNDKRFHAWAVEWYKANRAALSSAVEAVTGLPVIAPDDLYVPVRVANEPTGIPAEVVAWSPIPSQLNRRVRHGLDFDEQAHFLTMLQQQCEVRAQTIGYSMTGIILRDTIAHRDVQMAAKRHLSPDAMRHVLEHTRDILAQKAGREAAYWEGLNIARKWIARFGISGNLSSALAQPASIPVWANVLLDGDAWGVQNVMSAMASAGTDEGRRAIAELKASDGYRARYDLGWSEEIANCFANPSQNRVLRKIETAYDKGMVLSKFTDSLCSLWIAQGFYRHATQVFLRRGNTEAEAKRKALALTWAAVESTQQSSRTENQASVQRGRARAIKGAFFQFKTAMLLSNAYLFRSIRDVRAGTPGAVGRLMRAAVINTVVIPAYITAKSALWALFMGNKEEPEDEEQMPLWMREMLWNMVDGTAAPIFIVAQIAEAGIKRILDLPTYGKASGIPTLDSIIRIGDTVSRLVTDPFTAEEELRTDKILEDLNRLLKQTVAPWRHGATAVANWGAEE